MQQQKTQEHSSSRLASLNSQLSSLISHLSTDSLQRCSLHSWSVTLTLPPTPVIAPTVFPADSIRAAEPQPCLWQSQSQSPQEPVNHPIKRAWEREKEMEKGKAYHPGHPPMRHPSSMPALPYQGAKSNMLMCVPSTSCKRRPRATPKSSGF